MIKVFTGLTIVTLSIGSAAAAQRTNAPSLRTSGTALKAAFENGCQPAFVATNLTGLGPSLDAAGWTELRGSRLGTGPWGDVMVKVERRPAPDATSVMVTRCTISFSASDAVVPWTLAPEIVTLSGLVARHYPQAIAAAPTQFTANGVTRNRRVWEGQGVKIIQVDAVARPPAMLLARDLSFLIERR